MFYWITEFSKLECMRFYWIIEFYDLSKAKKKARMYLEYYNPSHQLQLSITSSTRPRMVNASRMNRILLSRLWLK